MFLVPLQGFVYLLANIEVCSESSVMRQPREAQVYCYGLLLNRGNTSQITRTSWPANGCGDVELWRGRIKQMETAKNKPQQGPNG